MKFKTIAFLGAVFFISLDTALSITNSIYEKSKIKNERIIKKPKLPAKELNIYTDTVLIKDETYKTKILAAGAFNPTTNTVKIIFFKTNTSNTEIQTFCNRSNSQIPLTKRHELEHAQKAFLTKDIKHYPPEVRAKIIAINEITALASEIIESQDYKYKTGKDFLSLKPFVTEANKKIEKIINKKNLRYPLDFNDQEISDIIINQALQQFLQEIKRGIYKTSMQKAFYNRTNQEFQCNYSLKESYEKITFNPVLNMWDPIWFFQSKQGYINLWQVASKKQKQKTINTLDSLIEKFTNQKLTILQR